MAGGIDTLNIVALVFLGINIVAIIAFLLVIVFYYDSFDTYMTAASTTMEYGIQQGAATMSRFGSDVTTDALNLKNKLLEKVGYIINTGIGKPVELEPCDPGYHNDGLTCRKPIHCETDNGLIHCSGGEVYGRLNHGGCCPCDRHYYVGLCYKDCPCNYTPLAFPLGQVCIGNET